MKVLLVAVIFIFSSITFASDNSEVNSNLRMLLKRCRQNAKYHFVHKRKNDNRSLYSRLRMKDKPSIEELVNELNIYKEIKERHGKKVDYHLND